MNEEIITENAVEKTEEKQSISNYFDMSDEEFAKVDEPIIEEENETKIPEETSEKEESNISEESEESEEISIDEEVTEESESNSEENSKEEDKIDYEALYKASIAPLKAIGKEIPISNTEELRKLAKMGIDYQRKMVGIKKYRKIGKQLDENSINNETLSYLIDLNNGKPEAIKKLLKDREIDPMELDLEEENTYKPKAYNVSDAELELQEVQETIKESPAYDTLVDVISNKWDDLSRQELSQNPNDLIVLTAHMEEGVYDKVIPYLEREKALGNTKGMSDVVAYKTLFNMMDEKGMFNDPAEIQQVQQTEISPEIKKAKEAKTKKVKQDKLAATSTVKASNKKTSLPDLNITDMSDDEFDAFEKEYLHLLYKT